MFQCCFFCRCGYVITFLTTEFSTLCKFPRFTGAAQTGQCSLNLVLYLFFCWLFFWSSRCLVTVTEIITTAMLTATLTITAMLTAARTIAVLTATLTMLATALALTLLALTLLTLATLRVIARAFFTLTLTFMVCITGVRR